MADIFVSWGSPDKTLADTLQTRLRLTGLSLFFSGEDMHAGQDPNSRVQQEIRYARVAVFFLSSASARRDWVRNEASYVYKEQQDRSAHGRGKLTIIPVRVGPMQDEEMPREIRDNHLHVADMTDPATRENALEKLVGDILAALGRDAPLVVHGAIFALEREQFQSLIAQGEHIIRRLIEFCRSLGLECDPSDLATFQAAISRRYGDTPFDYAPFPDRGEQVKLVDTVNDILIRINSDRYKQRLAPIHLRWDHDDLLSGKEPPTDLVQARRTRTSLTIVDSISVLDSGIKEALLRMPRPLDERRSALIWIPPYSSQRVIEHTEELAKLVASLRDAFIDWKNLQDRWVAFDLGSLGALRHWLLHALPQLTGAPTPILANLEKLSSEHSSSMNPQGFWG